MQFRMSDSILNLKKYISGMMITLVLPFPVLFDGGVIEIKDGVSGQIQEDISRIVQRIDKNGDIEWTGEIIIKFKSENEAQINKVLKNHAGLRARNHGHRLASVEFSRSTDLSQKLKELNNDAQIEYAEPDYIARAFQVPNDPYFKFQWSFSANHLDAPKIWDIATGKDVVAAVVDTGVAYENYGKFKKAPDLGQTRFMGGYNAINRSSHANDDNGHGTHVAGTIAQSTNNSLGVAGLAYNTKIMPVKVLDKNGAGSYSAIADGIIWAANNGANIINLSLGGPYPSETLRQALAYAKSKGVFIIAASGNDGGNTVSYPAAYDEYVTAVGASRFDKSVTAYSNKGSALDLIAPGGDMKVDQDGNRYGDGILQQTFASGKVSTFGYYFFQGTSMAAPHVAATAALLYEKGIKNPDELQKILKNRADDIGVVGWDSASGYGIVNPLKALQSLAFPTPTPSLNFETLNSSLSPTPALSPSPTPSPKLTTMFVSSVGLNLRSTLLRFSPIATVNIVDIQGNPVSGADVSGTWSGLISDNSSAVTDNSGSAKFSGRYIWRVPGEFVFSVKDVRKDGYEYKPELNNVSSGKIGVTQTRNYNLRTNILSTSK